MTPKKNSAIVFSGLAATAAFLTPFSSDVAEAELTTTTSGSTGTAHAPLSWYTGGIAEAFNLNNIYGDGAGITFVPDPYTPDRPDVVRVSAPGVYLAFASVDEAKNHPGIDAIMADPKARLFVSTSRGSYVVRHIDLNNPPSDVYIYHPLIDPVTNQIVPTTLTVAKLTNNRRTVVDTACPKIASQTPTVLPETNITVSPTTVTIKGTPDANGWGSAEIAFLWEDMNGCPISGPPYQGTQWDGNTLILVGPAERAPSPAPSVTPTATNTASPTATTTASPTRTPVPTLPPSPTATVSPTSVVTVPTTHAAVPATSTTPTGAAEETPSDELAYTGARIWGFVAVGAVLVALGVVALRRQRRP